MDILKLVRQIACAICQGTQKPKPAFLLKELSASVVRAELPFHHLMGLDSLYYYTASEDWGKVFSYIFFGFDMPDYVAERMDCDDFALLMKGLVNSFFGLNAFGVVFGQALGGYHAWNIFRTEEAWMQFEPQTGEVFKYEKGYEPQYVLI